MDTDFKSWPLLEDYAKRFPLKYFRGAENSNSLFYYDCNPDTVSGKPILVLVHGLGDEADTWRHIIPVLGKAGYRVLAPDLPGFGRSIVAGSSNIKKHCKAVLELIESVSGGAVLIGSSLGAAITESIILSGHLRERIKALILLDGCIPIKSPASPSLLISALPFMGKKWYRSFRNDPDKAWQSLIPYYADIEKLNEEDRIFLRKRVMNRVCSVTQERAYFSTLRSLIFHSLRTSYYRRIGSWPGRIKLIWGEKDMILPANLAESFIELRGNNADKLSVISGAGHLPHQEKPAETAKVILDFLETLS